MVGSWMRSTVGANIASAAKSLETGAGEDVCRRDACALRNVGPEALRPLTAGTLRRTLWYIGDSTLEEQFDALHRQLVARGIQVTRKCSLRNAESSFSAPDCGQSAQFAPEARSDSVIKLNAEAVGFRARLVLASGPNWGKRILDTISHANWWRARRVVSGDVAVVTQGMWNNCPACIAAGEGGDLGGAATDQGLREYRAQVRRFAHFYATNRHWLPLIVWRDTPPQSFNTPTGLFLSDDNHGACLPAPSVAVLRRGDWRNRVAEVELAESGLPVVKTWLATARALEAGMPRPTLWNAQGDCTHMCLDGAPELWNDLLFARLAQILPGTAFAPNVSSSATQQRRFRRSHGHKKAHRNI
eukprot:gene15787-18719_t